MDMIRSQSGVLREWKIRDKCRDFPVGDPLNHSFSAWKRQFKKYIQENWRHLKDFKVKGNTFLFREAMSNETLAKPWLRYLSTPQAPTKYSLKTNLIVNHRIITDLTAKWIDNLQQTPKILSSHILCMKYYRSMQGLFSATHKELFFSGLGWIFLFLCRS